ncbi:MAG: putative Fe-S cluster assembly protein SufT [Verrucomicrobia bacterium]|nr:putative Fe-S cluster assembly protein SufT [Verrucomicrobiota bacterium]MCF7709050.1 putative Fe-S cluster assembly protein SufT [Verrucomicrobiota bacterium]
MESKKSAQLQRDCEALLIPSGAPVTLLAGETVHIVQSLGGSFTVMINGNLARIDGKNADAIGREIPRETKEDSEERVENAGEFAKPVDEKLVWDQMRECYDPEIPINIVDLGLVYDCKISLLPEGGSRVDVKMTLTAPGCNMGPVIAEDVKTKVLSLPGVKEAEVELVWDPPWSQDMLSEAARLELGLF